MTNIVDCICQMADPSEKLQNTLKSVCSEQSLVLHFMIDMVNNCNNNNYIATAFVLVECIMKYWQYAEISLANCYVHFITKFDETLCLKMIQTEILNPVTMFTIHQTIANHLLLIYYVNRIRTFDPKLNFNYVITAAFR